MALFSVIRFNIRLLTFAKFVGFLKSKADLNALIVVIKASLNFSIHRVEHDDCNLVEFDRNSNYKYPSFKVKSLQYQILCVNSELDHYSSRSSVFIVNFEHISPLTSVSIIDFEQVNVS